MEEITYNIRSRREGTTPCNTLKNNETKLEQHYTISDVVNHPPTSLKRFKTGGTRSSTTRTQYRK
eukprot:3793523-Amphidinium_carterae.1